MNVTRTMEYMKSLRDVEALVRFKKLDLSFEFYRKSPPVFCMPLECVSSFLHLLPRDYRLLMAQMDKRYGWRAIVESVGVDSPTYDLELGDKPSTVSASSAPKRSRK